MVEFFIATHMAIIIAGILFFANRAERNKIITERKKLAHLLIVAARGRRYK
jgi:hypothetical protein